MVFVCRDFVFCIETKTEGCSAFRRTYKKRSGTFGCDEKGGATYKKGNSAFCLDEKEGAQITARGRQIETTVAHIGSESNLLSIRKRK